MEEESGRSGSGEEGVKSPGERIGPGWKKSHKWRSYETKLRAVKLYLEEGIPADIVAREIGVQHGTVTTWAKDYREGGLEALKPKDRSETQQKRRKIHPVVKARITAVKERNPAFGIKRISQVLRRVFMLKASRETVRRTLHRERLIGPRAKKINRKPKKIHFFEADAPNRMWQSDITRFEILRNENAYIVGFIDDHSRYITGLGVYMLQKAENVLEVYRRAVVEYGAPKEMLTDNGRQYVNWKGKTQFEKELKRDGVEHLRSQPHHPQTLGKIERFWKTIKEEFLDRAIFENFEQARERIAFWVKYYNHQRPHQGIDGMCPADRYFNIQGGMKNVINKGIEDNLKELAMRGRPEKPVYLVGRVGDKEVVVRSDNGKLMMSVDGTNQGSVQEVTIGGNDDDAGKGKEAEKGMQCEGKEPGGIEHLVGQTEAVGGVQGTGSELGGGARVGAPGDPRDDEGAGGRGGASLGGSGAGKPAGEVVGACGQAGGNEGRSSSEITGGKHEEVQCDREVPGSADGVGGEAKRPGNMQGNGDQLGVVKPVAGGGDGGYALVIGAEVAGGGTVSCAGKEAQAADGQEGGGERGPQSQSGEAAGKPGGEACVEAGKFEKEQHEGDIHGKACAVVGGEDRAGAQREHHGERSGQADGREPQDLLPEGAEGSLGNDGGAQVEGCRSPEGSGGSGKRTDARTAPETA